jgi:hypothetical protein
VEQVLNLPRLSGLPDTSLTRCLLHGGFYFFHGSEGLIGAHSGTGLQVLSSTSAEDTYHFIC